jgi:hypothetical protein
VWPVGFGDDRACPEIVSNLAPSNAGARQQREVDTERRPDLVPAERA